jgi:hypothetical protein
MRNAAQYWADDNARFNATNPSLLRQFERNVNPLTSFGSSMGQMYEAAGNGDVLGMAGAGVQAIPVLGGVVKPGISLAKGLSAKLFPHRAAIKTARNIVGDGSAGTLIDQGMKTGYAPKKGLRLAGGAGTVQQLLKDGATRRAAALAEQEAEQEAIRKAVEAQRKNPNKYAGKSVKQTTNALARTSRNQAVIEQARQRSADAYMKNQTGVLRNERARRIASQTAETAKTKGKGLLNAAKEAGSKAWNSKAANIVKHPVASARAGVLATLKAAPKAGLGASKVAARLGAPLVVAEGTLKSLGINNLADVIDPEAREANRNASLDRTNALLGRGAGRTFWGDVGANTVNVLSNIGEAGLGAIDGTLGFFGANPNLRRYTAGGQEAIDRELAEAGERAVAPTPLNPNAPAAQPRGGTVTINGKTHTLSGLPSAEDAARDAAFEKAGYGKDDFGNWITPQRQALVRAGQEAEIRSAQRAMARGDPRQMRGLLAAQQLLGGGGDPLKQLTAAENYRQLREEGGQKRADSLTRMVGDMVPEANRAEALQFMSGNYGDRLTRVPADRRFGEANNILNAYKARGLLNRASLTAGSRTTRMPTNGSWQNERYNPVTDPKINDSWLDTLLNTGQKIRTHRATDGRLTGMYDPDVLEEEGDADVNAYFLPTAR